MNSVPECIKAYNNLTSIKLETLCDISFLKNLDRARGNRHHTHRRYDTNYVIGGTTYGTVEKLRELTINVRKELQDLDQKLATEHKDYEVKVERLPLAIKVEWTAVKHALDMTDGGKIVPQKSTNGLDPRQIRYFAIQVNYKK